MKRPDEIAPRETAPRRRFRFRWGRPGTGRTTPAEAGVVPEPVPATATPVGALPDSTSPDPDPEGTPDALSPRAARKRVRQSERARRRYERREIKRFAINARRRRRRLIIAGSAAAAVLLGLLLIVFSPPLRVQSITVLGTQQLDPDVLTEALGDQMGRPIAFVSEESVAHSLEQQTLIKSIAVQAQLPSTLVVTVIERTPIGAIAQGDDFVVVDDAGVAIETVDSLPDGVPQLLVESATLDDIGFRSSVRVIAALPDSISAQLASVSATTQDSVTLVLRSGVSVVWGDSSDSDFKAQVLQAVLTAQPDAREVDVSAPRAPVVG